jgi:1,4-alpha-glucan branching enzyme
MKGPSVRPEPEEKIVSPSRINNKTPKSAVPGAKSEKPASHREDNTVAGEAKAERKASGGAPKAGDGFETKSRPAAAGKESAFETAARPGTARGADSAFETKGPGAARNALGTQAVAASGLAAGTPVKRTVTLVYDAGPHGKLTNLQLKGSWDGTGRYSA